MRKFEKPRSSRTPRITRPQLERSWISIFPTTTSKSKISSILNCVRKVASMPIECFRSVDNLGDWSLLVICWSEQLRRRTDEFDQRNQREKREKTKEKKIFEKKSCYISASAGMKTKGDKLKRSMRWRYLLHFRSIGKRTVWFISSWHTWIWLLGSLHISWEAKE